MSLTSSFCLYFFVSVSSSISLSLSLRLPQSSYLSLSSSLSLFPSLCLCLFVLFFPSLSLALTFLLCLTSLSLLNKFKFLDIVLDGPHCCVIIKGHSLDAVAIANSANLVEAGFKVKPDLKMKPRLVIHDVPVEFAADQIINCVVEQNLPDTSPSDYKAVYLYPPRNNNVSRTCIIELKPEHRARLLTRGTPGMRVLDFPTLAGNTSCTFKKKTTFKKII